MSSGMNLEQAKEYAKTMTYTEAVLNTKYAKGIAFKKATRIKLYELAEIADRLDRKTEPQTQYDKGLKLFADILFDKDKSNQFLEECKAMGIEPQTMSTPYKVDTSSICKIEPHTNCPKTCPSIDICTKDDTDCAWKKG